MAGGAIAVDHMVIPAAAEVGADVVEVAPAYDHAEITCVAAATLVFDLLGLMVAGAGAPA